MERGFRRPAHPDLPAARRRQRGLLPALGGADAPEVEIVGIQYPAREDRFDDPASADMGELVTAVADAVLPLLDRPYALFGHSMGSAVAWELAHELDRREAPARAGSSPRAGPPPARR